MRHGISRRRLIVSGLAAAAGVGGLTAAARFGGLIPPDHQGLYGVGETLTYASQRLLMGSQTLAREFTRADITRVVLPVNGPPPKVDVYQGLLAGGFRDWRLRVDGLVARPSSFSVDDLKAMPAHTQITHQACEEGWSFIAEWTGSAWTRGRASSCCFRSTSSGRASTWPTRCTRRRSSPTA
jgi:DMSO/TMAO reductase YedYZ molybdopterin-dependent catalytic subunit